MSEGDTPPILQELEAAAFNREVATYKGDQKKVKEAGEKFDATLMDAATYGVSPKKTNQAELRGKLHAAMENGKERDVNFFNQALEDLTE